MAGTGRRIRVLYVGDGSGDAPTDVLALADLSDPLVVETAPSSSFARDQTDRVKPDCVVTAASLTDADLADVVETAAQRDVPVVVYAEGGSERLASEAVSAGATDYLRAEATGPADLADAVREAVERRRERRRRDRCAHRFDSIFRDPELWVAVLDPDGTLREVNATAMDVIDADRDDVIGRDFAETSWWGNLDTSAVTDWIQRAADGEYVPCQVTHGVPDGGRRTVRGNFRPVFGPGGDVIEIVSVARDITERIGRERAIADLHDTARELMGAETPAEVAERTVAAVEEIIDSTIAGFYLHDEVDDRLEPARWTARAEELFGDLPIFEPGGSFAWEAFESGDTRLFDDVSTVPERYAEETPLRSELILPLDDHGVVLIGSLEVGAFDETKVSLAETLMAHATTALDRIQHERDLREERSLIEGALDALDDLFYVVGPDGRMRRWNGELRQVTGYADDEIAEMNAMEFFPEEAREQVRDAVDSTLTTGHVTIEGELLTKDGERIPYEFTGARLTDEDGNPTGLVGVGRDVTERQARKRELRQYEHMVDNMREAACIYDAEGRFVLVNEFLADFYGTTPEALEGEDSNLIPHVRDQSDGDPFQELLDGEREEVRGELEDDFPNYGYAVLDYRLSPLTVDGSIEGVVGVARVITERKERERALEQLHVRTRDLMAAPSCEAVASIASETATEVLGLGANSVHLYDADSEALRPTFWPDETERVIGREPPPIPAGEGLAWQAYETNEARSYADVTQESDVLNPETAVRSELYVPLGDHGVFIVGSTQTDAFDATDEALAQVLGANVETALDRLERERALESQNERMERVASFVSHDLRNPLNVAQGRLDAVRQERDSDHLETVARAQDRMETLIEELLTLTRGPQQVTQTEPIVLSETVERCWDNVATEDAALTVETGATIRADRNRFRQLLENLVRNSVEHGGPDPTVTVGDLPDGIYVADDGPGISEDEREHVFEVGYSTNENGTGLGLNIVKRVAEAHGWDLTVTESESGGARFEITGVEFVAE